MRSHEDFIPELDFVMELDGEVMGSIMYTKASLTDEDCVKKEILTFGPVCILVSPAPSAATRGRAKTENSRTIC